MVVLEIARREEQANDGNDMRTVAGMLTKPRQLDMVGVGHLGAQVALLVVKEEAALQHLSWPGRKHSPSGQKMLLAAPLPSTNACINTLAGRASSSLSNAMQQATYPLVFILHCPTVYQSAQHFLHGSAE